MVPSLTHWFRKEAKKNSFQRKLIFIEKLDLLMRPASSLIDENLLHSTRIHRKGLLTSIYSVKTTEYVVEDSIGFRFLSF